MLYAVLKVTSSDRGRIHGQKGKQPVKRQKHPRIQQNRVNNQVNNFIIFYETACFKIYSNSWKMLTHRNYLAVIIKKEQFFKNFIIF